MKRLTIGVRGLLAFSILGAGCTQTAETPPAAEMTPAGSATDSGHTHGSGPNGGVVFDLGAYHAEFGVDHGKQQVTVLMLGADMKSPLPVEATELIAAMHETKTADGTVVPAIAVTLKPIDAADGKAATFVGTDPGLGNVADFGGTVAGEIDGKPAQGSFQE